MRVGVWADVKPRFRRSPAKAPGRGVFKKGKKSFHYSLEWIKSCTPLVHGGMSVGCAYKLENGSVSQSDMGALFFVKFSSNFQ